MKQKKKKLNITIKAQRLMTGGSCPVTIPNDPVMDAMDAATPNLDLEVWYPYDSTAEFEKEYNIKSDSGKRQIIISDDEDDAVPDVPKKFDTSKLINTKIIKSNSNDIVNISRNVNNSKVAFQPDVGNELKNIRDEKELRLIKLREGIEQQRELYAIKLKVADAELKITLLKLSLTEETVQLQSEGTVITE
ncbi:PREDICTED: uncharacterized protein LOC108761067 [Trachymyrmex cornetzi]|uniref:uncharacterized protein LOC108761067 n=2 Tax=Trachymyrmex cornetzi TaxID=471704 RepID=UPI00084F2337|nr:PREDICTED: uncharacterized protein LOC108761067 [Trachymyrmex cornetzi]